MTDRETVVLQEKLQFQAFLCELISLCNDSQLGMGRFLSEFLVRVVEVMEGAGGSLWVQNRDTLELALQVGVAKGLEPHDPTAAGVDGQIPRQVAEQKKPYVVSLSADRPASSRFFAIYVPIEGEEGVLGVLQVIKAERESNVVYQEEVQLLKGLVDLVSLFMKNLRLPQVMNRMEDLARLFEIDRELFSSLEPLKNAYSLANLIPSLVPCDRCVVALAEGRTIEVRAISGQDLIERKSLVIKRLRRLLRLVAGRNDPVYLAPAQEELLAEEPALREAMEAYFKVHPFKALYALPLRDEERLLGVLAIEWVEAKPFSQNDQRMLLLLARQAGIALSNARRYHRLPLRYPFEKLGAVRDKLLGIRRVRLALLLAAVLTAAGAPFLVQVEHRIGGRCEIVPQERYFARPRTDGVLKTFLVKEGDAVQSGQAVALLDDRDLREKLRGARTRFEITRNNMAKLFGLEQQADYQIEKLKLEEIAIEIGLLESDLEKTRIVAQGGGTVLTPQLRLIERLGKAVSKGEELLEIADVDRLTLEVAVPEEDIVLVRPAQRLSFLLNSLPERRWKAEVTGIRQKAEVREEGNFFVVEGRLEPAAERSPLGSFRPGMKGEAKIYGENDSLAYVLFRSLINFLRVKVFF